MKNSFFLILTIISISLLSCKKEAAMKPTVPPPAVKAVTAVKAVPAVKTQQLYDYQKAMLVKRTITTH